MTHTSIDARIDIIFHLATISERRSFSKAIYFAFFNISSFCFLDNDLTLASSLEAFERSRNFFEYNNLTGLRDLVYFAPSPEELCSWTRRTRSTVMPVYKVLSAHFKI